MNGNPDKWVPALIGGAFLGLASAVPYVSTCCCLWMVAGGFLAVFVYRQRTPGVMMTSGEGALLGLMAAVVGSVIFAVISGFFLLIGGGAASFSEAIDEATRAYPDLPPETVEMLRSFLESGGAGVGVVLILFVIVLILSAILSTLGGVLGVAILQKKPPQAPPPQWSQQPPPPPAGGGVG